MHRLVILVALAAGCGGASVRPGAPQGPLPVSRIEVASEVDGTVLGIHAARVKGCRDGSPPCQRTPVSGLELRLVDNTSSEELTAVRTSEDGTVHLQLPAVADALLRQSGEYTVVAGDRRLGAVDLREARAVLAAEKDARDLQRHLANARASAEREEWEAVERHTRYCLRVERRHPECSALEEKAEAALSETRAQADAARRGTVVAESLKTAQAAIRETRWADAVEAAEQCLAADAAQVKCQRALKKARPRAVKELRRRSQSELGQGRLIEAREPARACLAAAPSDATCQQVLDDVERREANAARAAAVATPLPAGAPRPEVIRHAEALGYRGVIFDVGVTGAVNLMVVGRNSLKDFENSVIEMHQADRALSTLQVFGAGSALYTSTLAELPVLVVNYPEEIRERTGFHLLHRHYWVIRGVRDYQSLRGRRQAVVVEPAW